MARKARTCLLLGVLLLFVLCLLFFWTFLKSLNVSRRFVPAEELKSRLRREKQELLVLNSLFTTSSLTDRGYRWKQSGNSSAFADLELNLTSANDRTDLGVLGLDVGATWPEDSFCQEFLSNRFSLKLTPCSQGNERVVCYASPHNDMMGECHLAGVAVDVKKFYTTMNTNRDSVESSNSLWLLRDSNVNPCPKKDFDPLDQHMEGGDYTKRVTKATIVSSPQGECDTWVNGTTFFFMGFDVHIYFKMLSWYNLHNGLVNFEKQGQFPELIVRIPQSVSDFMFPNFEKRLFPDAPVVSLESLAASGKKVVCFNHIHFYPWAFSATPFRCKMLDAIATLRQKCYNCRDGSKLPGTRFMSFRRRVLNACGIEDKSLSPADDKPEIRNIVLQVRKAYVRHQEDELSQFRRVFGNSKELELALKSSFPRAEVYLMHAEDLPICDQVKMAHDADVFIGVHGAGLVHLWWMQDHALLFELNPSSQLSNPTFEMLSALTGRRYYSYSNVQGSDYHVTVDAQDVVMKIKQQY